MVFTEKELLERREAYFSKYKVEEKRKKRVVKDIRVPTEREEQVALVFWLNKNNYVYSKIGNDTFTSSWSAKMKNLNEGSSKGLCDMMILLKNKTFLFIELKKQGVKLKNGSISHSNSKVSEEQIQWLEWLNNMNSCKAIVCYGCDEGIKAIQEAESTSK